MLGAVTLVLLAVLVVQSKVLVKVPIYESNRSGMPSTLSSARLDTPKSALPDEPAPQTVRPVATPPTATPKKAASKAQHIPAKQIVVPLSIVDLSVQHQFKDATLYVWVDDKLELTLPLHGATQKKLVVFNGVRGVISQTLKVPAGKRVLRFRALSTDQTVDLSKTISADFVGGDTKTLALSIEKRNTVMRLTWQ